MTLAPFVRTDQGLHPTIDRDALLACYRDLPLRVRIVSSPSRLVAWERLRDEHEFRDEHAVPCDAFVWGTGPAPDPRLTRVGGVPFMPRSMEWPRVGDSIPSFLCQFNFCDSRDLVGETPGDILLVFAQEQYSALYGTTDGLRFRWVSAAETDVIGPEDVPRASRPFEFVQAWGVRHRTFDAPTKWALAYELLEEIERHDANTYAWKLPSLWATKIGGLPCRSQGNLRAVPADYFCQLVSIQAEDDTPWPWADREAPLAMDSRANGIHHRTNQLMIGDMGELTLFLSPDGSIDVGAASG